MTTMTIKQVVRAIEQCFDKAGTSAADRLKILTRAQEIATTEANRAPYSIAKRRLIWGAKGKTHETSPL